MNLESLSQPLRERVHFDPGLTNSYPGQRLRQAAEKEGF